MTTETRNEAAERPTKSVRMSAELVDLLSLDGWDFGDPGPDGFYSPSVRITQRHVAALAAERRATVERIRERITYNPMVAETPVGDLLASEVLDQMFAILDEEAR